MQRWWHKRKMHCRKVSIDYSSINYKDALAIPGRCSSIRKFPMMPGIDFAGTVIESVNPAYKAGDKVLLTGWGVGENTGVVWRGRFEAVP
ncbi:MAG: alcohol dehydrogenase catalytic domain-containing protein [Symbiopectobacterium sp.]